MKTVVKTAATGAILTALFATSSRYNSLIDDVTNVTPGATALQVVGGTAYTLAGVAVIVTVWQGVRTAAIVLLAALAAFAAAGYPMLVGDIRRDK